MLKHTDFSFGCMAFARCRVASGLFFNRERAHFSRSSSARNSSLRRQFIESTRTLAAMAARIEQLEAS